MGDNMLSEMMSNSPSGGSSGGGFAGGFAGGGDSFSLGSTPGDLGTLQMPNFMQAEGGREMGGFKVQTPELPGSGGSFPAQTPQIGDQFWKAGQNSSNPSPSYIELSSPYAPVISPYSTVSGGYSATGSMAAKAENSVQEASTVPADNSISKASTAAKYDCMPGINLQTVLDLPNLNLPEAGNYKDQLETAAYKLAKGDDVTNAHDREALEGTIANQVTGDRAAGRTPGQDGSGMKFLENEFNKIFEQAKWPVSVKMTEPAKDASDQNAKIELTKLDPATNKPTGETYTISIDMGKLQQK